MSLTNTPNKVCFRCGKKCWGYMCRKCIKIRKNYARCKYLRKRKDKIIKCKQME